MSTKCTGIQQPETAPTKNQQNPTSEQLTSEMLAHCGEEGWSTRVWGVSPTGAALWGARPK
eukprot:15265302-Alexandrium_andersonii.AAC.1